MPQTKPDELGRALLEEDARERTWLVVLSLPTPEGRAEVSFHVRAATWQEAQAVGEDALSRASMSRVLEAQPDALTCRVCHDAPRAPGLDHCGSPGCVPF